MASSRIHDSAFPFQGVVVIARNSSFTYKGRAVDVKQVGRELGVHYVLEGSVRRAAIRLRITGQLIDAATGSHLWADRFDGEVTDIFELQDQVTERVVGAIAPAIEKAEIDRAKRKPTGSLDAYSLYLRGLAKFYEFSRHANDEALRLFKSAIDVDPDFATAHGRVALCYVSAKAFGWSSEPSDEIVEVKRFSQRAVALGKDDAMALSLSGWALAYGAGDLQSGSSLIDRALVMNSNLADSWHYGGRIKNWLGEREVALERFAHAVRLSPLDPLTAIAKAGTAHCYFYLGRYDEAMAWSALAFQDGANNQAVLRVKAASNALAGRTEEAHEAVALLRQVNPTLRISNLKEVLGPYRQEDLSQYQEAMRRAGLPE
jgi:tetratricopeptide (TPR) repeat protein